MMKNVLLGSAMVNPIIACSFIESGQLKTAMIMCVVTTVEIVIIIGLDLYKILTAR
jgi:hypothetical protein